MPKQYPTQKEVRHLFFMCGANLCWLNPPKFLPQLKSTIAGNVDKHGYRVVRVNSKAYKAHRLTWIWFYGEIPQGLEIDHIDQNKTNNAITNLRLVTKSINMHNRPIFTNNTSGTTGIHFVKKKSQWRVRCMIDGIRYSLGNFKELQAAEEALNIFKKERALCYSM